MSYVALPFIYQLFHEKEEKSQYYAQMLWSSGMMHGSSVLKFNMHYDIDYSRECHGNILFPMADYVCTVYTRVNSTLPIVG